MRKWTSKTVALAAGAAALLTMLASSGPAAALVNQAALAPFHIKGQVKTAQGTPISGAKVGVVAAMLTGRMGFDANSPFETTPFLIGGGGAPACTVQVPVVQTNPSGDYDLVVYVTSDQGCLNAASKIIPNAVWAEKGGFQIRRTR